MQRYGYHYDSDIDADTLQPDDDGDWVLYNDHLAEIAEKDKEIERLNKELLDWSINYRYMKEEKLKIITEQEKEIARLKEELARRDDYIEGCLV